MADYLELKKTANGTRKGIVAAICSAKSGHPGGSLSSADIFIHLYLKEIDTDPKEPRTSGRDCFVLSRSCMAPGYCSTFAYRGFFPAEDLKTLRHIDPYLQGHPDKKHISGVDMSSGSLEQEISAATGMALSAKLRVEDYRAYTLYGDGELEEGQVQEAAMFVGFHKPGNLVVIVDNNGLQIDGAIDEVCSPYPIDKKSEAFQLYAINIDGRDFGQTEKAFGEARQAKGRPTAIIAKTLKGKGIPFMEDPASWHGMTPNDEQYVAAMEEFKKAEEVLCQE